MKKKAIVKKYKPVGVEANPLDKAPARRKPDEWEIRDARNTLERAEQIKANKTMMRHVEAAHKREADVLAKAKGVKK